MLVKSFSALAVIAFAANVAAEPTPYKPQAMKMSVRDLFGVGRRDDTAGYQPEQAACGEGNTCEEACGAGYSACASKDDQIHCYNPAAAEICCPNQTGNSCAAGYYCTSDKVGETWCCPDAMDVVACAAAYNVDGLTKQVAAPTSSAAPSTTSAPATSKVVESSATSTALTTVVPSSLSSKTLVVSSAAPSAGFPATNATTVSVVATPTPSPTKILEGAGNLVAPAGGLMLLVAGIAALL